MNQTILIRTVTEKHEWEQAVAQFSEANFLQSWSWGVFHAALGKQVHRFVAVESDQIVGLCQAVHESAKRGSYLAVAGGPICDWEVRPDVLDVLVAELRRVGRATNCVFIRLRPQQLDTPHIRETAAKLDMKRAPMHVTADLTLQLDLSLSDDELLAAMRKNTRASVRHAERDGIVVSQSNAIEDVHDFYLEQLAVAKRHGFVPFSEQFLSEQFKAFVVDGNVSLFHARLGSELLASAFIIFYNGEAVYHYGVSTAANAKLPGSYACQWAAIQEAKRRGCTRYNFWGIAPEDEPHHRFAGVSLFKRGFGGQEVAYLPAQDISLSWRYGLVYGFEALRRRVRRL